MIYILTELLWLLYGKTEAGSPDKKLSSQSRNGGVMDQGGNGGGGEKYVSYR